MRAASNKSSALDFSSLRELLTATSEPRERERVVAAVAPAPAPGLIRQAVLQAAGEDAEALAVGLVQKTSRAWDVSARAPFLGLTQQLPDARLNAALGAKHRSGGSS